MWCLLKSQLNGKAFLVLPADTSGDLVRIEEHLRDMKLSAELYLELPSGMPTVWSGSEIKNHMK